MGNEELIRKYEEERDALIANIEADYKAKIEKIKETVGDQEVEVEKIELADVILPEDDTDLGIDEDKNR